MGGWKVKILFLMFVFFAGFAAAVYCLTPVHASPGMHTGEKTAVLSAVTSDEFKQNLTVAICRFGSVVKNTAIDAYEFVKQKLDERHSKEKLVAKKS